LTNLKSFQNYDIWLFASRVRVFSKINHENLNRETIRPFNNKNTTNNSKLAEKLQGVYNQGRGSK